MNIKELKNFIGSQTFRGILIGLLVAVIALIIFQSGVAVGERRSSFAHRFGDNFEKNFRGPDSRFMIRGMAGQGPMPGGHGAAGEIISIELPKIIVAGPDNLEKTIVVSESTLIREFQNELTAKDLKVGNRIVILGMPTDEGEIDARLIRLVPALPLETR